MAALIGYLNYGHHAGTVRRLAHRNIGSTLKTWHGYIATTLLKDGTYFVRVNGNQIATGNVDKENK